MEFGKKSKNKKGFSSTTAKKKGIVKESFYRTF